MTILSCVSGEEELVSKRVFRGHSGGACRYDEEEKEEFSCCYVHAIYSYGRCIKDIEQKLTPPLSNSKEYKIVSA